MAKHREDVLIVGAGPVGLTLAIQLRRFGVQVRIIDTAAEPSTETKAMAVHSRTLELLRDLGVADAFVAAGVKIERFVAYDRKRPILTYEFDRLRTVYPFLLSIPQPQTERILLTRLRELGVEPERGVTLTSCRQSADRVEVTLSDRSRRSEHAVHSYVIGCDGGRSVVRQQLGISFTGASYQRHFMLADVDLEFAGSHEEGAFFLGEGEGYVGLAPIPGEKRYRFFVEIPGELPPEDERTPLSVETLQKIASDRGHAMKLSNASSLTRAEFRHRMVDRLREGRMFLAGDAAHIGSPIGGQYMNLGLNEAYNLGWKLGYVIQGRAEAQLLDSYEAERLPVARKAERTAHVLTKLFTVENPLGLFARNRLLPWMAKLPRLRDQLPRGLSGHAYDYRGTGATAEQVSPGRVRRPGKKVHKLTVKAGDLMPDALLADGRRLSDLLVGTRCLALLFAGDFALPERFALLQRTATRLRTLYPQTVVPVIVWPDLPPASARSSEVVVDEGRALHERFAAERGASFLIRPDGYVGYSGPDGLEEDLLRYLERTLLLRAHGHQISLRSSDVALEQFEQVSA